MAETVAPQFVARLRQLLAGGMILLGLTVLIGWAIHATVLIQVLPNEAPMKIATAVAFVLAGLALLPRSISSSGGRRLQTSLGCSIALIAIAMLVEHIADVDLGVDLADLQSWLPVHEAHPGRVSLNTAVGLALAGICLMAHQSERTRAWQRALGLMAFATLLIGAAALAAFCFGVEHVFDWHGYASMAIHTAVGLIMLGATLLLAFRESAVRRDWAATHPADRIAALAAAWLAIVALVAGGLGFIVMQREAERTIDRTLSAAVHNMTLMFASVLDVRNSEAARIETRLSLSAGLRRLIEHPDDHRAMEMIATSATMVTSGAVEGLVIYDTSGVEAARVGHLTSDPDLVVPIASGHATELMWKDKFMLRTYLLFRDANGVVGSGVVEQSLPIVTRIVMDAGALGSTGEAGVCAAGPQTLRCFPTRLHPGTFSLSNAEGEAARPIGLALQGKTGVIRRTDYRGEQIVAAYGPIGTTGLGAAIKIDLLEIYQPVRDRLLIFLPLLVLIVTTGAFALRMQVKPLASSLVDSRESLRARSEQLSQSNDELLRALASQSRFLATMSHELRTPLNAILGFTGVLLMRLPGPLTAEQAKQLGTVDSASRHLLSLINDLLDVASADAGKVDTAPAPIVAQDLVDDVIAVLRPSAEAKGLVLRCMHPEYSVTSYSNRRSVFQILINLTNNAVKYTVAGSVTVAVERDASAATTRFVVTDTGIGIRDADLKRLFMAFERLNASVAEIEGAGLGLHHSRKLARSLGGDIACTSIYGSGSRFVLTVPDQVNDDHRPSIRSAEGSHAA